jgi:hypothetical protein
MVRVRDPDLVKVTELFLIPSSFLVAALGTADTNLHRAGVSIVGLLISGLWVVCSREALAESRAAPDSPTAHPRRTHILVWLPFIFAVGWLISTVIHALLWNQRLGSKL